MMPPRYERDDARRRVVVTGQGPFVASDVLAVIERQRAEGTWTYGMLYDLRRTTGHPTHAELREMMSQAEASPGPAEPTRGPVAILATDPILYGIACTYAALGRAKLTIRVFRDYDEAELWLASKTTP